MFAKNEVFCAYQSQSLCFSNINSIWKHNIPVHHLPLDPQVAEQGVERKPNQDQAHVEGPSYRGLAG